MSFDLNVSMKRKCMPSPAQWQAAITDAGFHEAGGATMFVLVLQL